MAKISKITVGTIIKLILLSLAVGLILSFFGITPAGFWEGVGNLLRRIFDFIVQLFEWGLIYIIIGAAVVVPVFILNRILKARKDKK